MKSVLSIGTFDGVHRGHQKIVRTTCELAAQKKCVPLAITFDIPPRLFFAPALESALLTTVAEKKYLLEKAGIKKILVLHFNYRVSQLSAKYFFEKFIMDRCRAQAVVAGYNFGFGKNREGDIRFLEKIGAAYSIPVRVVSPFRMNGAPVSSGRVRNFLKKGNLGKANALLGHPYFLMGSVIAGRGIGRKLGFPTANISIPPQKIVPHGVFAVRVSVFEKNHYDGVCNVGYRPTLSDKNAVKFLSVEAHLFNFSGNLYGRRLKLEFLKKLRSEKKFKNAAGLKEQIKQDQWDARAYFAHNLL